MELFSRPFTLSSSPVLVCARSLTVVALVGTVCKGFPTGLNECWSLLAIWYRDLNGSSEYAKARATIDPSPDLAGWISRQYLGRPKSKLRGNLEHGIAHIKSSSYFLWYKWMTRTTARWAATVILHALGTRTETNGAWKDADHEWNYYPLPIL